MAFTEEEARELAGRGISTTEAARQLVLLAHPPVAVLDRPCTVGDGIERWSAAGREQHERAGASAAEQGRLSTFVPASGAATRMFKELIAWVARPGDLSVAELERALAAGDANAAVVSRWWDGVPRFAFAAELMNEVQRRAGGAARYPGGPLRPWLEALLETPGLGYAERPKGLLAFHRTAEGVRTAFEEHLAEGAALLRDHAGRCRMHLTVSPEHRGGFELQLATARPALEATLGACFEVEFSVQHPATDTLAADPAGGAFRDASGRLLFRPAGHGALLGNLAESRGDLVFVKNVDNVACGALCEETVRWARALCGRLAQLEREAHAHLAALETGADRADAARAWLLREFGDVPPAGAGALVAALDRPLRVCGMVPNTGEPGGGPFWVRDEGGVRRQIVERAQVELASSAQRAILASATHFNPVFLACALRDRKGAPRDLEPFMDPDAVIVTRKSALGRELLALERPGLWNGAMAHWLTAFVEVPLGVFNPVKTVLDLLRPEHQP